jgi:O-Antigen ligase
LIEATAHNLRLHPGSRAEDGAIGRRLGGEGVALKVTAFAVALLPLAVPQGPANTAPIDLLVAGAVAACVLWATAVGFRCRFPYVIAVMLALVGGVVGALVGPVPTTGAVALVQDVVLIAWCWAIVNIAHSPSNLRLLLSAWVYSSIGWAVLAFIGLATGSTLLTGQIERQGTRLQLTLADPSYTANYFFISIMIMWATRRPRRRVVRLAAYALLFSAIAATGSNSGMVAVVVGTVIATILGTYRRFGAAAAVAASALIFLTGIGLASTVSLADIQAKAHDSRYSFLRQGIGRSTDSAGQRESLLSESIRLYRSGSPFGEGPVSTKPRLKQEQAPLIKEAHNDYLAALVERGPIGFIGILALVCSLGVRGVLIARRRLATGFAAVVARPNALVGAVAGTLVASTVYELLHVRHIWALFAFVAALSIWGRD